MAKKGKRCKRCGQVNPVNETICVYCKSEDSLKKAKTEDFQDRAFKIQKKEPFKEKPENKSKTKFSLAKTLLIFGVIGAIFSSNINATIVFSLAVLVGVILLVSNSISDNCPPQSYRYKVLSVLC